MSIPRIAKGIASFTLFVVATLVPVSPALAAVIHIAPTGSDVTGNGSPGNPYYSLEKAEVYVGPGDTILMHQGTYEDLFDSPMGKCTRTMAGDGYWWLDNLFGAPDAWITIMGAPGESKPVLNRITLRISTQYCERGTVIKYVRFKNFIIQNTVMHAINIDEGGEYRRDTPSHHVEFSGLEFYGSGYAGIKMAGIDDFLISDVVYANATGLDYPAFGIDMVGCHNGVIEKFVYRDCPWQCINNRSQFSAGFMIKGGSCDVVVRDCYVEGVFAACMAGQTTTEEFFRPPVGQIDSDGLPVNYEAKRIVYYTNIIVDASIPMTFSNSIDSKFVNNTIYCPRDAETGEFQFYNFIKLKSYADAIGGVPFVADRGGEVSNNIVVFGRPSGWYPRWGIVYCQDEHNQLSTFVFNNNLFNCVWAEDYPDKSEPDWNNIYLADGPPAHSGNIYGVDPLWVSVPARNFRLLGGSPAIGAGLYLSYVGDDYDGNPYHYVDPAIGAFEFGEYEPSPPSTPSSLHIGPPLPGR